jgi:hypothetical protein
VETDALEPWNSQSRSEKTTKTRAELNIPVHPVLQRLLEHWEATGWEEFIGRKPKADDLILPRQVGEHRTVWATNERFQADPGVREFTRGWTRFGCTDPPVGTAGAIASDGELLFDRSDQRLLIDLSVGCNINGGTDSEWRGSGGKRGELLRVRGWQMALVA